MKKSLQIITQGTNWVLTGVSQQKGVGGEAICFVGVPPKLDQVR